MARPQKVDDEALLDRLSHVFRAVGYEGASLARLAEAAGMQGPSLYHRFPGGKRQMAEAVLGAAGAWYAKHVFAPLTGPGTPAQRIDHVARSLDTFYAGGRQACLLNLLSQQPGEASPFADAIREIFHALITALSVLAHEAGLPQDAAYARAQRTVALLNGSLVLARGMQTPAPFHAFTATLGQELGVRS